jgi:hypothetical protein
MTESFLKDQRKELKAKNLDLEGKESRISKVKTDLEGQLVNFVARKRDLEAMRAIVEGEKGALKTKEIQQTADVKKIADKLKLDQENLETLRTKQAAEKNKKAASELQATIAEKEKVISAEKEELSVLKIS